MRDGGAVVVVVDVVVVLDVVVLEVVVLVLEVLVVLWAKASGGATPSIAIALLPVIFNHSILAPIGWQAGIVLGLSTLVVQVMKRNILRTRPTESHEEALVVVPDRFSFPSGHATAVMSVAFVFAVNFPALSPALLCVSSAVGLSRVRLGVHYPGDVVAGQGIALLCGIVVVSLW